MNCRFSHDKIFHVVAFIDKVFPAEFFFSSPSRNAPLPTNVGSVV